jgi:hypothetical protein
MSIRAQRESDEYRAVVARLHGHITQLLILEFATLATLIALFVGNLAK